MKLKAKLVNSINIFRIIGKYEPLYLVFVVPSILISSLLTILYVYFPKLFIEQLTNGNTYREIAKLILIYIGILLILNGFKAFLSNKITFCVDHFSKKLQLATGSITMSMPLADMEGANFSDKLAMANNVVQVTNAAGLLQNIIANVITIIGLAVIITRLDIIFVLLVCLTLLVKICFVYLTYRHNKKRRREYAANDRIGSYLDSTAYFNQGAAKELRFNNLKNWFMSKIKGYRTEMLRLQYGDFRQYALFESITAIIMAAQSFVILSMLAARVIDGTIGIADFTMYFSAVSTLTVTLSAIVGSIGEYNRQQLYLSDFDTLSENQEINKEHFQKEISDFDIVFENVSFAYPNTKNFVLENINIRISAGEKLSVVGKNGAGKSTFIKLLCRFYRPTCGKITIGGVDIWEIESAQYNKLISAVFQDYQNFSFTIKENVSMGQSAENVDEILSDIGLDKLIEKLPEGTDTYLTRNFSSTGVELSGGEGQKLAIARAVYKNSPILILDEPTAALDPKAESEIYDSFFKVAKGKTTIFISHRLASSTVADKIAYFENGRITEYSSHTDLMKDPKEYAKMFDLQRKSYVEN